MRHPSIIYGLDSVPLPETTPLVLLNSESEVIEMGS